VVDSQNWAKKARALGFSPVGVACFWIENDVRQPHAVCYVGPRHDRTFIDPQYGWRIELTDEERSGLCYSGHDPEARL
jgi:hypothetical protein